jgi:hypothetical protein
MSLLERSLFALPRIIARNAGHNIPTRNAHSRDRIRLRVRIHGGTELPAMLPVNYGGHLPRWIHYRTMTTLIFEFDGINDLALEVTKAIVDRNEESGKIDSKEAGPLAVAAALSDFFEIAAAVDQGAVFLDSDELAEFAEHGLDLLDRLAYQLLVLEVMEHRENMARIFASIGIWLARREATLENLEGIADGFGRITNGLTETSELAEICQLMEEVAEATSTKVQMDDDRSNPYRPWRVLNLNAGIAATRSLDPELMKQTFDNLGRRLPQDMPYFLADGRRQLLLQEVPDAVRDVVNQYAERWPTAPAH